MKMTIACLIFALLFGTTLKAQQRFNGSFEEIAKKGQPKGWDLTFNDRNTYEIKLDSLIKVKGKYSVSISSGSLTNQSNAIDYTIERKPDGKSLALVGSLKTENVTDGFAGLWIRVDGIDGESKIELMESQALKGTHDWKEYLVTLPYSAVNAKSIHVGVHLSGKGKVWVDNLKLYVDEKPIDEVKTVTTVAATTPIQGKLLGLDTLFTTSENVKRLATVGRLWAFLKYHHPAVAAGNYNWDAELFKLIPSITKAATDVQFAALLEKWVDDLGEVPICKNCKIDKDSANVALKPDYGALFVDQRLTPSLVTKLKYIIKNGNIKSNFYVSLIPNVQNPSFENETIYNDDAYPALGYRLLALYRYWAIVQYFSPNRMLTRTNWDDLLPTFIPQFILAKDKNEYTKTVVKLISNLQDGHGFLSSATFRNYLGKYRLPVDARYIEDQLVVVGYLTDDPIVKEKLKIGDALHQIDGVALAQLIDNYRPLTSASNFATAMRDMPNDYLLRSDQERFQLMISRDGQTLPIEVMGVDQKKVKNVDLFWGKPGTKAYQLLNGQVGYILGNRFKRSQMDSIKLLFANTKGLIIDMRGYPIDDMRSVFGDYLNPTAQPFVKFTTGNITIPGTFTYTAPIQTGRKNKNYYRGKVVVLVNETTQSNAEFVTMGFQTAPQTKVFGSTTAGADGNISWISLPGGFKTCISGIGVYYPDGTNAQQAGVKIDEVVKPSIKGVKAGVDELLARAQAWIEK
jgi:C-terminal processing protease CtpA/Prc